MVASSLFANPERQRPDLLVMISAHYSKACVLNQVFKKTILTCKIKIIFFFFLKQKESHEIRGPHIFLDFLRF